MKEPNRETDSI